MVGERRQPLWWGDGAKAVHDDLGGEERVGGGKPVGLDAEAGRIVGELLGVERVGS